MHLATLANTCSSQIADIVVGFKPLLSIIMSSNGAGPSSTAKGGETSSTAPTAEQTEQKQPLEQLGTLEEDDEFEVG